MNPNIFSTMNAPPYNTSQFVPPPGGVKPPAIWQLMMPNQQFPIPFHNENHPPLIKPSVSSTRFSPYRVELCLNFQRGNCNYGDKCRFAHCVREPLARFDNPGSSVSKARLCWRYFNGGRCAFGERCHFIHDSSRKSVAISVVNRDGGGGSGGEVKSGMNPGKHGYQRPHAVKTRLCFKWMTNGSCPYGHKCVYAHGESELRKSENVKASAYVAMPKTQVLAHQWEFKWTDIDKISRIYADWIESMPLVHDKSDTMDNQI